VPDRARIWWRAKETKSRQNLLSREDLVRGEEVMVREPIKAKEETGDFGPKFLTNKEDAS